MRFMGSAVGQTWPPRRGRNVTGEGWRFHACMRGMGVASGPSGIGLQILLSDIQGDRR